MPLPTTEMLFAQSLLLSEKMAAKSG